MRTADLFAHDLHESCVFVVPCTGHEVPAESHIVHGHLRGVVENGLNGDVFQISAESDDPFDTQSGERRIGASGGDALGGNAESLRSHGLLRHPVGVVGLHPVGTGIPETGEREVLVDLLNAVNLQRVDKGSSGIDESTALSGGDFKVILTLGINDLAGESPL